MSQRRTGIYRRGKRWWGDFRAYAEVSGRQEPLTPDGARQAVTDYKLATLLYARRIEHYERLRQSKVTTGVAEVAALAPYAEHHLAALVAEGRLRGSSSMQGLSRM